MSVPKVEVLRDVITKVEADRMIFYPNKRFIPPKGTIARTQWDKQEDVITKYKQELAQELEREKVFQEMIDGSLGLTDEKNGAYLLAS